MTRPRRSRAFTLVELMVVVTIIGVLARIALPKYQTIRLRARAAQMISKLNVIRGTAYMSFENTGLWPLDAAVGKIPTELTKLLPGSLSFTPEPTVSFDWLLSGMTGGDPARATAATTMGMGISTTDAVLRAEIQKQLKSQPTQVSGNVVYWLMWGPTSKP